MRISRFLGLLALLSISAPSLSAQQPAPCPLDRACYYAAASLSSRRIVEPKGFQVWGVDSSTHIKSGWLTVAIRGGYRKFIRVEDMQNFNFQTGVAPDMERVGSPMGIPYRKDQPAVPAPRIIRIDTVLRVRVDTVTLQGKIRVDTVPKEIVRIDTVYQKGCGNTFSCHPVAWIAGTVAAAGATILGVQCARFWCKPKEVEINNHNRACAGTECSSSPSLAFRRSEANIPILRFFP
ncbi:MAG: hypothetical protein JWN89_282 [Parcubacteria group bacterium]|nr:hypothetical protein [Parcubacteria group bacterium]